MRTLSPTSVTEWVNNENWWVPRSIDTNCPFCKRAVNFALEAQRWDPPRKTMLASSRCSGCGQQVSLFVVDPGPANDSSKKGASCIAIFPGNQDNHQPIEGSEHLPDGLRRAYNEAIQVYNAKVWSATTTLCRRTLEGMVMHLTNSPGAAGRPLAQMLRELPSTVDLGRPITSLADSVRLGGNMGAHFDMEAEPDHELARTMLDLLEYLLEYFFTIPRLIAQAQGVLDRRA